MSLMGSSPRFLTCCGATGGLSDRALKRRFDLDDGYLEDLQEEIISAKQWAGDEDGRVLVWVGETQAIPGAPATQAGQAAVTGQAPLPQSAPTPVEFSPPDAERRQLTVMFFDLADSTRLSGQLDPEDLRDVIRAYQSTSTEVIERYDSYIAQHLGDGLMVYFGWPQAHERARHSPEGRYPPLHLSPQRQRQKTLETIVAMLLQRVGDQPVLFILEDLHWTDPTTLELLAPPALPDGPSRGPRPRSPPDALPYPILSRLSRPR